MRRGWVVSAVISVALGVACAYGDAAEPKEQQDKAAPAPIVNSVADQALRDAALEGRLDLVAVAVDQGARINAPDSDGRTALMYAAFNGHTECIRWLLERKRRWAPASMSAARR